MNTLKATKRDMTVKAKQLRREGFVTGCIYGREIEPIALTMEAQDVDALLKDAGKGSQVMLNIDGTTYNTLIKELDYNAMKHQIEALDFQALVSGEKVQTVAEIVLENPDNLKAGILQQMAREVAYKAIPSALVENIPIDVAKLNVGDVIKVADLDIAKNEDVDLVTDPDTVILTVTETRQTAEQEKATEGEGAEEVAAEEGEGAQAEPAAEKSEE